MPKAINICVDEAERIKHLPDGTVLISINTNHAEHARLQVQDQERVLSIKFDDLRGISDVTHGGKRYVPMSVEDAHELLSFIKKHQEKDFIVHCTAGISRSSAVCLFLHTIYGHELKPNFWLCSDPNEFILGRLMSIHVKKLHSKDHQL